MNSMLVSSNTSDNLQEEAILSTCNLQNRIPHKKFGKLPMAALIQPEIDLAEKGSAVT